jgi:ABC-2 type transport system permease protein
MPIYDQSYAHWKGRLEGHVFRWLPITLNGIRLAFRTKLFRILFIFCMIPFVVRAGMIVVVAYAESMPQGPPGHEIMRILMDKGHFYYGFLLREQLFGIVAMCLFAGCPLVARDIKSRALEVYFSKPILLTDYLLGKFMVVAFFLACMSLFPGLLLMITDLSLSEDPDNTSRVLEVLPRVLAVSLITVVFVSILVLAASSLARSARNAAVVWFAFHLALFIASRIAARIFATPDLKLLDPRSSLQYLGQMILDYGHQYAWSWWIPSGYLCLLIVGALAVLVARIRAVEVVKD